MAIPAGNAIRDEPIGWLDRLQLRAKVVRKLIQDDLPLLRFILAFRCFAMKDGFPISDQSGELIIQPNQMAGGFTKA
jgi:hypothetical protein